MKPSIIKISKLFIGNGFGVGKSKGRYLFAKDITKGYMLSISDNGTDILSPVDPDTLERNTIARMKEVDEKTLSDYFHLDEHKQSHIDWIGATVNVLLLTPEKDKEKLKNYIIYSTWPAIRIAFVEAPTKNCLIIFDRTCTRETRQHVVDDIYQKGLETVTDIWSMTKLLAMTDHFGILAPEMCMEVVLRLAFGKSNNAHKTPSLTAPQKQ
ncbi:hypothetical protein NG821_05230 [Prevotella cerevisiae]|uniref:Uncharacterized protein n=1 Tax=Segatella cerevisiae TaxID=2053716 RepID=A0ABT1BVY7_9BACT|nr:hypothetical protein [Segatella cerevisiae]MCO6025245.1 hypothetical protein [Segatella cerevisiae]